MKFGRTIPITGIGLALATVAILVVAGTDRLLALAAALIWITSLWLVDQPAPLVTNDQDEGVRLTATGMRDLLEHSGVPMLVLDRDRIEMANAMAREIIGGHIVGQDARVAFRHPDAIELLSRPGGGSATIHGLAGPRSVWQMSRHPIDERYSLVELLNRTSEADIGKAHTDFVANASHELRTPLASIIGYMETLAEGEVDAPQARRFYDTVLREARRLQNLVADLMSLSRIEAEKHDQPREEVDLAALAGQASRDAAGPDRQQRLRIDASSGPVVVRGDSRQLEQLVCNLVDNALKYGEPGRPVTISIGRDDRGMAVLSVADQGEGIAAEHLPHLTRRFYRTDPGRSRAGGGTGLGLAIVKHIVERHQGQLDIASRRGEGTTVTVRLPLAE